VIEMTGSEMVMTMLSGLLLGMLVGIPVLIWVAVLVGLLRRGARDLHERLLDHADERRRRTVSRHVWVSVDDVLPGQRQPVSIDHSVLPGAPLDDQPVEVIAAVAQRVFHTSS
jgi:type IV secretory pathway TrbD component